MSKRAERLEVVLSDNIRLRCGCRRATVLALRELVLAPTRRKAHLLIVAVICQRCGAGWEWGEVCAAPGMAVPLQSHPLTAATPICI